MFRKLGLIVINFLLCIHPTYALKEPNFNVDRKGNEIALTKQAYSTSQNSDSLLPLLNAIPENLNIGILVVDANTHKEIFKKNTNRYFIPASNQKLFTAFAALNYLKPDFVYNTYLFADLAKIDSVGTLNDNIYFKFSGDPSFTINQLEELINALVKADVRHINGEIIVDDSAFNQIPMSPGTTWEDRYYCYGSPITALILNHNCVNASLRPGEKEGDFAILNLPEYPQDMIFKSIAKTFSPNTLNCDLKVSANDENTYLIKGCIKTNDLDQTINMSVKDPHTHFQAVLFYLLNKYQIKHPNKVKFAPINHPVKLVGITSSPSLSALITTMLKESDNTIANVLFKTMGSLHAHQAGSWSNGKEALHDIIKQHTQIDLPEKTLLDGAGTSRYNYLTPQQIVTLLEKAYSSSYIKQFISSLPLSGVDGTLKNRMQHSILTKKIYAKTGTERGVTSLAGYIKTQKNHTLIFAILINGFVDSPTKYKELEERICEELFKKF